MERNNNRRNLGADAGRGRGAGGDEGRGGGGGRGGGYYNQRHQRGQYQGGAGGRDLTQMANNPRPAQGYRPVQGATNAVRPISSGGPVNQMDYGPLPAHQRGYRPVQAQRPPAVGPQQQLTNNPPASQPWGNRPVHAQRPPAVDPQQQLPTNPPASQPWGYHPVMGHDQGGSRSQVTGHGATEIGVMTQCCLSENANKERNDQFLANLALKMNAKVGGSNFELGEPLPGLEGENHVMFIGADVNHPAALNATSPSIAAVVATVNWPAVNRYAARVRLQGHRKEQIMDFGSMCLDLVNTYARLNKVKPKKIVIFRDGVSDGQFDMVLNGELLDLKNAIYEEHYKPDITLIVAQKRHHTRLFLENERDGARPFNVPPGTVVDSTITHPTEFDFFLCSHFGGLGTSKSTHYQALWDKHHFTSDQLQKLIYDLCFTFARCTKPVSLVPPVYYADLVAYRGRLYHDAAMELQSRASVTSSSSKTSSSSSSAGSFDNSFFKVHPNLQDSMYFV